ncbi:hypothetical protein A9Q98_08980 [Thalassotalea sp. 42_200_T64]|nr:hypothetical protein A9Q98_08980 [Thalassotalea sp. 42_200_T64]
MHNLTNKTNNTKQNKGFTFLELIIAMMLGLFVIVALYAFFASAKVSNQITNRLASIQETGRFTVELISRDIQRSGYFGGNANIGEIVGSHGITTPVATTCLVAGTTWGTMIEQHIFGLNDSNAGYLCITDDDYLRGDILTLRYATPWTINNFSAANVYLRSSLFKGRIFLGSDALEPANNNIDSNFQSVHQLVAHSYYIGKSDESCKGENIPALFWKYLDNGIPTNEQLLLGVEHLQIEYGVDTNNDGSPNQYLAANAVPDWQSIAAVRVSLLIREDCPDPSYQDETKYTLGDVIYQPDDNYHRLFIDTTIALRNTLNNS